MYRYSQKTIAWIASAFMLCCATSANGQGMQGKMNDMFNNLGLLGDVNGPGAFKGQTMNLFVGGEMQLRAPVRNYSLYSYQMPHFKAGCGGVDAYLGSFSFINKDSFKALLQQVGNNTVGLLFQSAIASISPLIASKLEWLQKIVQDQGIFNKSTCQMASMLVDGMAGMSGMNSYNSCVQVGMSMFNYDQQEAGRICAKNQNSVNAAARTSGNADIKDMPPRDINLVWAALKPTSFTKAEKEMFMNLSGTYIIRVATDDFKATPLPTHKPAIVESIGTLEHGNRSSTTTPGNIIIDNWMTCSDADECLNITHSSLELKPFTAMIGDQLRSMAAKMKARNQAPTNDEKALVNHTSIPVYKMLAIGTAAPDSDLYNILIDRYAQLTAFDYAYTFLRSGLRDLQSYTGALLENGPIERDRMDKLSTNVSQLIQAYDRERTLLFQKLPAMNAIVNDLQQLERAIYLNSSAHVKNTLQFSARLGQMR